VVAIHSRPFVLLVLKMFSHMQITVRPIFSLRTEFIQQGPLHPKTLLSTTSVPFFTQREKEFVWFHMSSLEIQKMRQAVHKILKKLRVSQSERIYDLLTFSHNFLDDFDSFFQALLTVSKHQIFSEFTLAKVRKEGLQACPIWFHYNKNAHLSEWVVQQLEVCILNQ
jgi:hypothetical protein